jgi:hypothetical protein
MATEKRSESGRGILLDPNDCTQAELREAVIDWLVRNRPNAALVRTDAGHVRLILADRYAHAHHGTKRLS